MTEDPESHSWRIALRGDLDAESAPDLQARIDAFVAQRASLVIVDLADVSFLDSSGLRALVHGARALESTGGRLLIEGASGAVARVLELTDLLERLTEGE
jgi:anti-sigma B factor antagonist